MTNHLTFSGFSSWTLGHYLKFIWTGPFRFVENRDMNRELKATLEKAKALLRIFLLILVFWICLMIGYDAVWLEKPMFGSKYETVAIVLVAWVLMHYGIHRILRPK